MKIDIGIATAGRRELLSETLPMWQEQTRPADELIVSPAEESDLDENSLRSLNLEMTVVRGPRGSSAQRNTILNNSTADIVVFFDDDFIAMPDYLAELEILFTENPDIVVATGAVLADGIIGPGLSLAEGKDIIASAGNIVARAFSDTNNGYGCNMAVNMAAVRQHAIRFDETLPLYAWLEDVDFSRQLAPFGRIVKAPRLRGVHLGTKRSGRSPGKRLGYSQVANPIYLARKGTMPKSAAARQIIRNLLANAVRCFRPEPWVDRRGRLLGNLTAFVHFLWGRITPTHVLNMS